MRNYDKLLKLLQSATNDVTTEYGMKPIEVSLSGPAFDGHRVYIGRAFYYGRKLEIDRRLTAVQMLDTLKHELAHFMAEDFENFRGHGWIWRRYATMLGCDPHAIHRGESVWRDKE